MDKLLTRGAITAIMRGEETVNPVFQLLGHKKIAGQGGVHRYRLHISDGDFLHSFALLATHFNGWMEEGKLDTNCIFRCTRFSVSSPQTDKKIVLIQGLVVIHMGRVVGRKLLHPQQWTEAAAAVPINLEPAVFLPKQSVRTPKKERKPRDRDPPNQLGGGAAAASVAPVINPGKPTTLEDFKCVVPIMDLTPYSGKLSIKARITRKGEMHSWSNAKGNGMVFNLDLLDDSGEIHLVGFNQAADSFYDMLKENEVYYFVGFSVKPANQRFSTLKNDYELQFTQQTPVLHCQQQTDMVPKIAYNFVQIASIESAVPNLLVDVIGVCTRVGEVQRFTSRTTSKEFVKRDIYLVDETRREVCLTLWDKIAEDFDGTAAPVVAAKRVKVSDYNGRRSLSLSKSGIFQINPDMSETQSLREWYDKEGSKLVPQPLTAGVAERVYPWKYLRQPNCTFGRDANKIDYFMSKVTIMEMKRETAMYKACPSPNCNKKVVDIEDGMFRCEKCENDYPNFQWRVMLQVNFADETDYVWSTCFQEAGEFVLGNDAETLGQIYSQDEDAFLGLVKEALFKTYIVKFKSKLDTFKGELRLRTNVVDIQPVLPKEYVRKLLNEMKESM